MLARRPIHVRARALNSEQRSQSRAPASQAGVASALAPPPRARRAGRPGRGERAGQKGWGASAGGVIAPAPAPAPGVWVAARFCARAQGRGQPRPPLWASTGGAGGSPASVCDARPPARRVRIAPAARGRWLHTLRSWGGRQGESARGAREEEKSDLRRCGRPRPAGLLAKDGGSLGKQ
ncbi:hypothetical protein R6Z07F_009752 [Ovis aries]